MKYDVDTRVNIIARKLNIRDKKTKLETARQINQLAILLIELNSNSVGIARGNKI